MMDLIKYEFYKLLKQKVLWITLLLMFLGVIYFSLVMMGDDLKPAYEKVEGPITEQKLKAAHIDDQRLVDEETKKGQLSPEKQSLRAAYDKLFYVEHYRIIQPQKISGAFNQAESADSQYEERQAELKANMLKDIHYNDFEYQRPMEQAVLFMSTGSMALILVFIILSASQSYTSEYMSGVVNYLFSSVNGRRQTLWAKLLTNWMFIIILSVFSTLIATVVWGIYDSFSGWNSPLQSIERFYESPYSLTIGQYLMLSILLQILAGITLSTLIVLISLLSKNVMQSIVLTIVIIGIPMLFVYFLPNTFFSESFLLVMQFAPSVGLNTNILFRDFVTIPILGVPVLLPIATSIFWIALLFVSLVILSKWIKKKQI